MIGIYKIINPIGQVYIGQSIDIDKRFYSHKKAKKYTKLGYSIKLYGYENHIFEIIEECDSADLNKRERFWQEHYDVMIPKKGLNGCMTWHLDGVKKTRTEHRYWTNWHSIGYEYLDYNMSFGNIDYLVEGVVEIMEDSKYFFVNDIKINGTSVYDCLIKSKKRELNEIITKKINNV